MHRSGTSAVTGALNAMGVFVGEAEALTDTNWENPLGFFERRDARALCDALLHGAGADWWKVTNFDPDRIPLSVMTPRVRELRDLVSRLDQGAGPYGAWALKEPRLCLLLPVLRRALTNPHLIMVVRHPVEVARSLRRRNGFSLTAGLALWEAYVVATLENAGNLSVIPVLYDNLINAPEATLQRLAEELANRGVQQLDAKAGISAIRSSLRREEVDTGIDSVRLSAKQKELWTKLQAGELSREDAVLSDEARETLLDFESDETSRQNNLAEIKKLQKRLQDALANPEHERTVEDLKRRIDKEKATAEKLEAELAERIEKEKENAKKLEADLFVRVEKEKSNAKKLEADLLARVEKEKADAKKLEADLLARIEKEKADAKKLEADLLARVEKEKVNAKKLETDLLARIEKEKANAEKRQSDLSDRLGKEKSRAKRIETELTGKIGALDALTRQLDSASKRLERLTKAEAEAEAALTAKQASELELRNAKVDIAEKRKSIAALEKTLADAKAAQKGEIAKTADVRRQLAASRAALKEAELRPRALELERDALSVRLLALRANADALRKSLRWRAGGIVLAPMAPIAAVARWRNRRRLKRDALLIEASDLFDREAYRKLYPDLQESGLDPLEHYITRGWREGREPGPRFVAQNYLDAYPDVLAKGVNPLLHYLTSGKSEGRLPNPPASSQAAPALMDSAGGRALIEASGLFDRSYYLEQHPDVRAAGVDPLDHFLASGWHEGRAPGPGFDSRWYLESNPDVKAAGMNPLVHYITNGRVEGRPPLPNSLVSNKAQSPAGKKKTKDRSPYDRVLRKLLSHCNDPTIPKAIARSEEQLDKLRRTSSYTTNSAMVSVIMPTWNRAHIVHDAIKSVLAQEFVDWELLVCDDASTDNTAEVVKGFNDPRIRYLRINKGGAAAARNVGLAAAQGGIIAYLDSDNLWHPAFLLAMTNLLSRHPGHSCAYADFIDYEHGSNGDLHIRSHARPKFVHENLLNKNFIDLNSFVHRRELYDLFGGFNENLTRRQDYDLILKYTWLRDPLHLKRILALYQRNDALNQITKSMKHDESCIPIIDGAVATYLSEGLPVVAKPKVRKVTIISWDLSRNHYSKPFALAEALSSEYDVQVVAFRFFEEMFPPLKDVTPTFRTVYIDGTQFPDFFDALKLAMDAIDGEIIYVVKPRLPSLGLALLSNYTKAAPIVLEINDLETVVSSPNSTDSHRESDFEQVDLRSEDLLNPYSDHWSHIMDPIAKTLPVLVTHNKGIDAHFDNQCLYMRNLKDESVYNPAIYDREAIREELGFSPNDRIILFGGLLRKHKGIYELVDLVERLGDPSYKLLFVGSRVTPDQERLIKRFGERIRVLPPQDRPAMARINLAADLVILWLDPNVPASHYQMPYKATDALAMGTPIIANGISDLEPLGKQGYVKLVPFGDWDGMTNAIKSLFANPEMTQTMKMAGRRLFLRQFSYAAARANFALASYRALNSVGGILPAAVKFSERFNTFYKTITGVSDPFVEAGMALPLPHKSGNGPAAPDDDGITVVTTDELNRIYWSDPDGIAVIMPCIDTEKGYATAKLLQKRSGTPARVFVVEDIHRKGFIETLNMTAARISVKYIVYLAEDAFPGINWLKIARTRLDETGKGLLAFNCGKWHGRIAAFGMVRTSWIRKHYGHAVLYPGYSAHKADNEITVIARASNQLLYDSNATLVEYDPEKPFRPVGTEPPTFAADSQYFFDRFDGGFGGAFAKQVLRPFKEEYFYQRRIKERSGEEYIGGADEIVELNVSNLDNLSFDDPDGIAVIMPSINLDKARRTAILLQKRANSPAKYFLVDDTVRQGFIKTLNDTAARLNVKYVVYLAEDAFPGADWLKLARDHLESTGKGLLAFNCGKWHGRIAAFGMVNMDWVKHLYGGPVLFPEYEAHKADNEITAIARTTSQFVYAPDCVLVEFDPGKVFVENVPHDKALFRYRFRTGFDGLAPIDRLEALASSYFVPWTDEPPKAKPANAQPKKPPQPSVAIRPSEKEASATPIASSTKGDQTESATRDTFALYRIIGNDLYPRHRRGQSFDNLKFILDHEPELEGATKRFVLNRIVDEAQEEQMISLLEATGTEYLRIPFEIEAYRKIGFDTDSFHKSGLLSKAVFNEFEDVKRDRAIAALYRLKNNYAMNNNGARNFALADGRSRATWILPWDGNCFLTKEAWEEIRRDVANAQEHKYFTVPMARMTNNEDLINGGIIPEATEEPQIIFHHDAAEMFNESFCYGRRPKVELLWRLKVPGVWDKYRDDAWDQDRLPHSEDSNRVGRAGWTARLFSGMSDLEQQNNDGALNRGFARTQAIVTTLRRLDRAVTESSPENLVSMDSTSLQSEIKSRSNPELTKVVNRLRQDGNDALARGPYSVCDKTTLPPSGDKRDYWHPAPYWWPNPDKPNGLPYTRRDGERVPGTKLYELGSEKYDRTRLQRVFDDSLALALAYAFTSEKQYAEHASTILERFFVNPETRMNPHLKYGQVRLGHNMDLGAPTGLIEMKDIYFYLDAVRLVKQAGAVSEKVSGAFDEWLEVYLDWLLMSDQGKAERRAINNHGTCYDLQIGAIAAYLDDQDVLFETLARANTRIATQFAPDGSQPDELKRKTTAHYCCFNMQSWINLANLGEQWGVDLWAHKAPNGASLGKGAQWLLEHMGKPWPFEQIDAFNPDRFLPIWFAALPHLEAPERIITPPQRTPFNAEPVFFPHDGIRPFWSLGMSTQIWDAVKRQSASKPIAKVSEA
ncbi:family 2 glycosyl transferase [Hyphomonas johnsonii MHS-2]|uniref:Family 2 glycosyl transferase n=2 Tax=Hyphomonas johnsonii TaxID=81031 RepID=A0A059FAE4_9PROT|nr:family 2 glycosyl transferase [Hyphomonas johnsonii MHS-2]